MSKTWLAFGLVAVGSVAATAAACSSSSGNDKGASGSDGGTDATGNETGSGNETGASDAGTGTETTVVGDAGWAQNCIVPTSAQTCAPPVGTALPICALSMTGCMDPANLTKVNSKAVYYEVNSPLWSDGAAKSRAFVLPAGGKIHVKNCEADAGTAELAYCMSAVDGPEGPLGSGEWAFPVGTVMIKNFVFNQKLVETRLLMHVDDATAAIISNGTNWVGYTYMWNEAQTEAVIAPSIRTEVMFTPVPVRSRSRGAIRAMPIASRAIPSSSAPWA
jgi:hypothetical protein